MRVLVTGARGLLGAEVVQAFSSRHEVHAVDIEDFDVTKLDAAVEAVRDLRPPLIVHCAAFSAVDDAEHRPDDAFRVNALGAKNIALAANEVSARILHLSTDYVFDGLAGRPYIESDTPSPLGTYGRSKWMGEHFVRELAREWTVVRTQALFGVQGPSFVRAILRRVREGKPLRVVNDQTVCPTRAADLAAGLLRIAEDGTAGIYHASANGACTWFEFAEAVLEEAGVPDHALAPISSDDLDRPAPRPPYSVLRNLHLELSIGDTLPHWREGLRRHFRQGAG